MPEIGTVMRALELQRLVETKVTEWRERSARVAGPSVADSYQHNFKRHTNRRKNSAEINRIIAKYSRPIKRTDERRFVPPSAPPVRPARKTKLKASQSEDNLANIGVMDSPMPVEKPPRGIFSKYNARSCEDITAFVDYQHTIKSKNFEENSILNSKTVTATPRTRQYLHSISEAGGGSDMSAFDDSGLELRHKPNFATSTPISNRKTCPVSDSISVIDFEKCPKYHSVSELKKGNSEPDILSRRSVDSSRTLDFRKPLKLLKQPFKKGTLDRLLRWRGKKPGSDKSR